MSKFPNPVRGYVPCPVCHTEATVHQVGEGRLMAEGEPTKNARNLGLKYYRCPNCGNSSMSKTVNNYIEGAMTETPQPDLTTLHNAEHDEAVSTASALEVTSESVELTGESMVAQTNNDKVESTDSTVANTPTHDKKNLMQRVLLLLGVLLFVVWLVRTMVKKKRLDTPNQEVTDVVTA